MNLTAAYLLKGAALIELLLFTKQLLSILNLQPCDTNLRLYALSSPMALLSFYFSITKCLNTRQNLPFSLSVFACFSMILWSVLAFGWCISANWSNSSCLSSFELTRGIIAQLLSLSLIGILIFVAGCSLINRPIFPISSSLPQDLPSGSLAGKGEFSFLLRRFYVEKTSNFAVFLLKNKESLKELPLMPEEKSLLQRFYKAKLGFPALFSAKHPHYKSDCPVCFCELEKESFGFVLACGHAFHSLCLEDWLKIKAVCPVCKAGIRELFIAKLIEEKEKAAS